MTQTLPGKVTKVKKLVDTMAASKSSHSRKETSYNIDVSNAVLKSVSPNLLQTKPQIVTNIKKPKPAKASNQGVSAELDVVFQNVNNFITRDAKNVFDKKK